MVIHTVEFQEDNYSTGKISLEAETAASEEFLDGNEYWMGYKVVTEELESLGLRGNENIIQYPENEWHQLEEENIEAGEDDWGGIWSARTPGKAKSLSNYMEDKHSTGTRVFKAAIDQILFHNDYRIKSAEVNLFEEL